jgi:hypothetical protein
MPARRAAGLLLCALLASSACGGRKPGATKVLPPDPLTRLLGLLESGASRPSDHIAGVARGPSRHERADGMLGTSNDGRWGYLLLEVGGRALRAAAVDESFEPASTLKVVYLLHALRRVDAGELTLETEIPWYRASTVPDDPATPGEDEREWGCPLDRDPATGALGAGLRAMMERSDNRWTQAVRRYFGEEAMRATAREAGMERTLLRHRIGCGTDVGEDPGQQSAPNSTTLGELCGLVEGVATHRLLSARGAEAFFELMAKDPLIRLQAIIREEGASLGLSPALLAAIERRQTLAWKSGKYNIGEYKCQSVVGLARLVSWSAGELRSRKYVFGVFVDDARRFPEQGTRETLYSLAVASELLREEVRSVLGSYRDALSDGR